MKRAREATKELERKTEALASARGGTTGNFGGDDAREKRRPKQNEDEKRRTTSVLEEDEEKENGTSTFATRRAKKTKACAKEKERETKKTNEDDTKWSLFPAMTPRKPPQSARGRGKGIAAEIARRKKEDGRDEGIWKTRTATKKKTITTAMTARETKNEREKYATGDCGEYHRLESLSSLKSNSRETTAKDTALLLLGKPSNDDTNKDTKNAPVIIEEKETIEARVIRESMSASHALRFHKERLEEEDARDLDARVNDETDDFRVFYLPPPPNKTTTKARNGLSAIAKFAQQRSRTKKKAPSKKNTTSRTDSKGDYRARPGDHLAFRFEVKETLGSGTFGRVVKCVDHDVRSRDKNTGEKQLVAVKIIKNKEEYRIQAKTELAVLEAIESARIGFAEDEIDGEEDEEEEEERALRKRHAECVVRAIEHFNFRTHACIVFELLHCNLYEWMLDQRFVGASECVCKTVAKQLVRALSFLKSLGIIHCDVKPENILLEKNEIPRNTANPVSKLPYPVTARAGASASSSSTQKYDSYNGNNIRVKLIDFGSSCFAHVPRIYPYVQSRFYRAPEVMLRDRQYDQSIDMWSFACVLAELKRGSPIWPGTDEAEQLELAKETLGAPSSEFLYKLRCEEEIKKASVTCNDTHSTKNSHNKNDHGRVSLSRVVPTTPMKPKKGVKSRLLLAERSNDAGQNAVARNQEETPDDANEDVLVSVEMTSETAREKAARAKRAAEGLKKALGKGCSTHFAKFLRKCFEWDPEERMTPDEALRDAWLLKTSASSSTDGGPVGWSAR